MPTLKRVTSGDFPRFGDIFNIALEPVVGSEIGKQRPGLIVSNNTNNEFSNTVTILPVTSSYAKKSYPFEVSVLKGVGGLTEDSRIKADQIRTVDKKRLVQYRGSLPAELMSAVQTAVKVHLNMSVP